MLVMQAHESGAALDTPSRNGNGSLARSKVNGRAEMASMLASYARRPANWHVTRKNERKVCMLIPLGTFVLSMLALLCACLHCWL